MFFILLYTLKYQKIILLIRTNKLINVLYVLRIFQFLKRTCLLLLYVVINLIHIVQNLGNKIPVVFVDIIIHLKNQFFVNLVMKTRIYGFALHVDILDVRIMVNLLDIFMNIMFRLIMSIANPFLNKQKKILIKFLINLKVFLFRFFYMTIKLN